MREAAALVDSSCSESGQVLKVIRDWHRRNFQNRQTNSIFPAEPAVRVQRSASRPSFTEIVLMLEPSGNASVSRS